MVFMLSGRDTAGYNRLKKSCDCRYGVMSQMVLNTHVRKCQGQYISNVCLKVNAKLGGSTARAIPAALVS
jgi:eukaryotic translation initiation factor 2C